MHLLKLTSADTYRTGDVYVNPDSIAYIDRRHNLTHIVFSGFSAATYIDVDETPEQIAAAIETLDLFPVSG